MTKFVYIARVHPVENGEPNTYKVKFEYEFDTKEQAQAMIAAFNEGARYYNKPLKAVYLGCVNDETGELV